MGCMQSTTDSNVSQSPGSSSLMLYRLITERYNIQVQPPSLQNSSMIQRMHARSQCPSSVFVSMELDKVFQNATDDSDNSDSKSEKGRRQSRSHFVSLRDKRVRKVERGSSEIAFNH